MPRSDIPVITPYNPLDKRNLAESVASAMLHTPVQKLPPEPLLVQVCMQSTIRVILNLIAN